MSQDPSIQSLVSRAVRDLPFTVEHEVFGPHRILFKLTRKNGESLLVGSKRTKLFELERCLPTMKKFFVAAAEVRLWPM